MWDYIFFLLLELWYYALAIIALNASAIVLIHGCREQMKSINSVRDE